MKQEDYTDNFESWCRDCVRIIDKQTGLPVPFVLNAPQRRVLGVMEEQRRAGRPVRLILLKARQWGGSTLVQIYMAWMQLVRRRGWNSVICGHVKDAAANIRGMYSLLLRNYPEQFKTGDKPRDWEFAPFEKSQNVNHIAARDCRVTLATAVSPDSVRGNNFAMAHLSEVAFWGDGDRDTASRIVRTVSGSVMLGPDTVVVMESTANGEDNYFHDEWMRAVAGESDKVPVFVAWHEIEIYSIPLCEEQKRALTDAMDDYERRLHRELGVSLESIAWYHAKRREYSTREEMMAEYPSTPEEAFASSGKRVFTDAEIPGSAISGSPRESLTLFAPSGAGGPHIICRMGVDADRRVTVISDELLAGNAGAALEHCIGHCRRTGSRMFVVDLPSADRLSPAMWCVRRGSEAGVTMSYDPTTDEPYLIPDGRRIAEMIEIHRSLVTAGMVADISGESGRVYRALSYPLPAGFEGSASTLGTDARRCILRLTGAMLLDPVVSTPPLSVSDFL